MNVDKALNLKRWKRLREFVLARDQYLDQELKRFGKRREAKYVHHIFPREFFPEWTFEEWNLISLSAETHNKLHDRSGHFLTEAGWSLLLRAARKNKIEIQPFWHEQLVKKD